MRVFTVISIAGLALAAGAVVERVKAEQAFLCEGGRIVYAQGDEVERLKRTDPCVAGYFGVSTLRTSDTAPAPAAAIAPTASAAVSATATPEIRILNARPEPDTPAARKR